MILFERRLSRGPPIEYLRTAKNTVAANEVEDAKEAVTGIRTPDPVYT